MNLLITICARGGSKGVPRKNILSVAGHPLIAYTISDAQKFGALWNADIVLSTEDEEIREISRTYGLESAYRRPKALAGDKVGKVAVIRDAWQFAEQQYGKVYDYVLDLDVAAPLRTLDDLQKALDKLERVHQALVLYSVNTAHRNPYYTMVEEVEDELVILSKRPEKPILSRQSAPAVYDLNGSFYYYRRDFLVGDYQSVTLDRASTVYEMPHICFDIDHKIDLQFLEFLIEGDHLEFTLSLKN